MSTTGGGVPFIDIIDSEFDFNSPEMAEAQARSWYAESPVGLLVLRYAESSALLRDPRLDHNGKRYMETNGIVDGPVYDWFVPMIVNRDGPEHRRLRGLVNRAFTPRMVDRLRPFIRDRARRLAEHLASAGVCEFVEDFANPLPLAVMCELLGVPAEDYDTFSVWSTDLGLVFSLAHSGDTPARVEAAVVGLNDYVDALMTAKRTAPGDDLISAMLAAQQEVTAAELRNLIVTLIFGAHDSTRHQLANAMVTFTEHPDQWRLLASRPELAELAVEEVIRWRPSSPTIYRFAATDLDFQDVHIARETQVLMCVATAQRDPRAFRDSTTFDITALRETPALEFGAGPHHCLGNALARAELAEALPALATRLPPPVVTAPLTWRPPMGIHGPTALPLRF